jgi:hypothetical protein
MSSNGKFSFFERAILGMQEIVGGQYLVDDAFIARVKRKVYTRCTQVPPVYSRNKLARRLEQAACEAVVEAYAETFPGRAFRVSRSWPLASCIIDFDSGEQPYALVEAWLGIDWSDEGIGAVRVPVSATVKPTLGERVRKTVSPAKAKAKAETTPAPRPAIPRRK